MSFPKVTIKYEIPPSSALPPTTSGGGATGSVGPKGDPGEAATIEVGTTETGPPGSEAEVTNSGDSSAAVFNFMIPQGVAGPAGSAGAPGTQWFYGNSDPPATVPGSRPGDLYLNMVSGDVFELK